jgi:hypothetical protein
MHHLRIQAHVDAGLDEIVTHVFVDNQPLVDFKKKSLSVDLYALEQSIRHSGDYFIVTCICGYPSCGSIKQGIRVCHTQTGIEWTVRGLGETETFSFEADEYRTEVRRSIQELKQLIKSHDLQVAPEINHYMYAGKIDIA